MSAMHALINRCPVCEEGAIYAKLLEMNETCPVCGQRFEREQGYFTGAMALNYVIGFFLIIPVYLFTLFIGLSMVWTIVIPAIELLVLSPLIIRYSRLLWIALDRHSEEKNSSK